MSDDAAVESPGLDEDGCLEQGGAVTWQRRIAPLPVGDVPMSGELSVAQCEANDVVYATRNRLAEHRRTQEALNA